MDNKPLVDFNNLTAEERSRVCNKYNETKLQQEHAMDPLDNEFFSGAIETFDNLFGKKTLISPKIENNSETLIPVQSSILLDALFFCAARYCIGRHSYVSAYASDIWEVIEKNFDKFNPKRLAFFAKDIRSEISERVSRYFSQFTVEGSYNHSIVKDAHTLLCEYLQEHRDTDMDKTKFHIDCVKCTVETEPYEPRPNDYTTSTLDRLPDHDLTVWSRLAGRIDEILTKNQEV